MEYIAPVYKSAAEAKNFPVAAINSFHWEKDGYSRPESYAALFAVEGDKRYINFEVNPKGVYLSQIGENRENRRFIKEFTNLEPVIMPMEIEENGKKAWGYEIIIPEAFISDLYDTDYKIHECEIKGNFYKCADSSATPHYGAHFPVTTAALGFHNPECFGKIIIRKAD